MDFMNKREKNIFKYELILNFLSKRPDQKLQFVYTYLKLIGNYEEFIKSKLLPHLQKKITSLNSPEKIKKR